MKRKNGAGATTKKTKKKSMIATALTVAAVAVTTAITIVTDRIGSIAKTTAMVVGKILGKRNTEDKWDIAIPLLPRREWTNPLSGLLTQGQRNTWQATGSPLSILFRLDKNAGWCPELKNQGLWLQNKKMCL